jgi:hypothetical protein
MKRFLKKLLIISAVFMPVTFAAVSCSEDAPSYINSTKDLVSQKWGWETEEGDIAGKFEISISQVSENTISINNFQGLGNIEATVNNDSKIILFSGKLGDDYEVKAGTGTIKNEYQQIDISYDIFDLNDETTEHIKATLTKDSYIAKKAVAEN